MTMKPNRERLGLIRKIARCPDSSNQFMYKAWAMDSNFDFYRGNTVAASSRFVLIWIHRSISTEEGVIEQMKEIRRLVELEESKNLKDHSFIKESVVQSHYLIEYRGYNPIGAYAIVMADSPEQAEESFYDELEVEEPELFKHYQIERNVIHKVTEIEFGLKRCHIISNGDY